MTAEDKEKAIRFIKIVKGMSEREQIGLNMVLEGLGLMCERPL